MENFLKASTKAGSRWFLAAKNNEGYELSDIYDSYSVNKEKAYNWCLNQYNSTENSENFRIISHNSNFFTVAWEEYGKEPKLHIETAKNSYVILLNQ